jgi:hypothetical protein
MESYNEIIIENLFERDKVYIDADPPRNTSEALVQSVAMLEAIANGKSFGAIHFHEKLLEFKRVLAAAAMIVLFCCGIGHAQGVVDVTQPEITVVQLPAKPESRAEHREFVIEAGVMAASWAFDTAATQHSFNADPAIIEGGWIFPGSRSTAKVMGMWAIVDVGTAVVALEWKNHVHNKYLHPLWRVPMAWRIYGHTSLGIHDLKY